jgi:hypothetical protein
MEKADTFAGFGWLSFRRLVGWAQNLGGPIVDHFVSTRDPMCNLRVGLLSRLSTHCFALFSIQQ